MPVELQERRTGASLFPSSDHFPLGRAYGRVNATAEPASPARPFGLTLAVQPRQVTRLNPADLAYDEDEQSDAAVCSRVSALLDRLSLRFAALDFVVAPDGEWWFLECNPNGQWAWIEDETGMPIAHALADALEGKPET